jgi:apolipoprotein D and lipocalin family protein
MNWLKKVLTTCGLIIVSACVNAGGLPPIKPVAHVDLPRFMGAWYVIATIPTRFEKNAYNAVETYTMQPDGNIYTAFRFNNGSYTSPVKAIHSTAFVKAGSGNAVWGVQVFWPVKAQYIVAYLKDDYSQVIVARDARDYIWIMARTPKISQADYDALMERVKQLGYPVNDVRKVPQQWPET